MLMFYAVAAHPAAAQGCPSKPIRALSQPEAGERMLAGAVEAAPTTPEGLAAIVKAEIAKAIRIIREAGIKGD